MKKHLQIYLENKIKTTICPNCKTENQSDAKKCYNCNKDLIAKTYSKEVIIFILVFIASFIASSFYFK